MLERITVQLPVSGLLFWKLSGREALSEPFELSVTLLGSDARIDRSSLLGQPITVTIPTQSLMGKRYLNGKVTRVAVSAVELGGTRYAEYRLTMEPDLWPMKRDRNLRIFQGQTVPQIVKALLGENQVNVEDRLTGSYRPWEYCVQYQESSLAFISRLMELEGIAYHFVHEADKHTLVLTDAPQQHQPFSGYESIPYHVSPSGGSTDEEGISQWALEDSVTPGIYSLDDYDFRKPNAWLFQARQNPASPSPGSIDVYDWPGRYVEHGHGEFYARIRQERWQVDHQQIQGTGTAIGLAPGYTFALLNAPFFSDNGEYLTTAVHYQFEENRYASGDGGETIHRLDFMVIPSSVVFRPAQVSPWPRTYGPQTAKVVGPKGESIWTDKYGRIKVKFHWDRQAKGDDTSSGWVRVSSAWAGQGFGGVQIPRVGDEVVIDFINGDPDRPIVTGRVYNEASMPPWALPAAATQMGFMTRSKDGHIDNASHLYFEDKPGAEMLSMHSEKDMRVTVENDQNVAIDGNRTTTILKEQKDEVTKAATFDYLDTRTTTVVKKETKTFKGGEKTTITKGRDLDISGDDIVKVKDKRDTTITGDEFHHVTQKMTEIYDRGQETTVGGTGRKETIKGGVDTTVTGDMTLTVNKGKVTITCPQEVKIMSSLITLDAPNMKENSFSHKEIYIGNSYTAVGALESVTGATAAVSGVSLGIKALDAAYTHSSFSHKVISASYDTFGYSNQAMEFSDIKLLIKNGHLTISQKLLTMFL